jgi:ComF family protein
MGMVQRYLRIILDTLFPPTSHERLLRSVPIEKFALHYCPTILDRTIALATYNSRTVQAAVAACKFEKNQHAATLLASLLIRFLDTHTTSGTTILIPIPLSEKREQERGFNQVTRVIEKCTPRNDVLLKTNWLVRSVDTVRQTSLGRSARLQNMKGAFEISPQLHHVDWTSITRIIVCDDVTTTGATLEAARTVLQKEVPKHVKIMCLAWAH